MKNIAIFASGSGTNAENIIKYFINNNNTRVTLILTNNKDAFVIERAKALNIPVFLFNKNDFSNNIVLNKIYDFNIDFIVLAGFLLLIPDSIINAFNNKIINIHPALLPKYGGKGMYGENVHKAVIANNETESGITIHYVNKNYDEGDIIFQKKCSVNNNDTAESLAKKIHKLEHKYFPIVIDKIIKSLVV